MKYVWDKKNSFESSWLSVSCNETGEKLIAGNNTGVYISVDYGNSWILSLSVVNTKISVNSDYSGFNLVVLTDQYFYVTTDGGITWSLELSKIEIESNIDGKYTFELVSNDSTGKYVYITTTYGYNNSHKKSYQNIIYKSSNYGKNLKIVYSTEYIMDTDYKYRAITTASNSGYVYIAAYTHIMCSTDNGENWQQLESNGSKCIYICSNELGDVVFTGSKSEFEPYNLVLYENFVENFKYIDIPQNNGTGYNHIIINDKSDILAATISIDGDDKSLIYNSFDGGKIWTTTDTEAKLYSWMASNKDGSQIIACVNNGYIYIGKLVE